MHTKTETLKDTANVQNNLISFTFLTIRQLWLRSG